MLRAKLKEALAHMEDQDWPGKPITTIASLEALCEWIRKEVGE